MLSPHEFATLLLVKAALDYEDLNGADVDALLEQQLVMRENATSGCRQLRLTVHGHSFLDTVSRYH